MAIGDLVNIQLEHNESYRPASGTEVTIMAFIYNRLTSTQPRFYFTNGTIESIVIENETSGTNLYDANVPLDNDWYLLYRPTQTSNVFLTLCGIITKE